MTVTTIKMKTKNRLLTRLSAIHVRHVQCNKLARTVENKYKGKLHVFYFSPFIFKKYRNHEQIRGSCKDQLIKSARDIVNNYSPKGR